MIGILVDNQHLGSSGSAGTRGASSVGGSGIGSVAISRIVGIGRRLPRIYGWEKVI